MLSRYASINLALCVHFCVVYSACLLASHNMDNLELDTDSNPMFFVNVADIDTLSTLGHYIACK